MASPVGYLCPEALDGAPIALIQDGDVIHVDLNKNLIEVEVSDDELARRKQDWKPVIHENGGHLLARYAKQVAPPRPARSSSRNDEVSGRR